MTPKADDSLDPAEFLQQWRSDPDREVWLIDETKHELPPARKEHRELIVFTVVRTCAGAAAQLLDKAASLRQRMRPQQRARSFKSSELLAAFRRAEEGLKRRRPKPPGPLAEFAHMIGDELGQCPNVVQVITTHRHIDTSPDTKMTSVRSNRAIVENTSKQLNLVRNVLHQLLREWSPDHGPVDAVIDRSQALGLDPKQAQIEAHQFMVHRGKLQPDDPVDFQIIASADTEVTLRDVLLLPDLFGHMTVRQARADLDAAIRDTLSGAIPFRVVRYEPPKMIAALPKSRQ